MDARNLDREGDEGNEGGVEPARQQKRLRRLDGSLDSVNPAIVAAASDAQAWLAERRARWPTKARREAAAAGTAETGAAKAVGGAGGAGGVGCAVEGDFQTTSTKTPCRFFARGCCRAGSKCRFAHVQRVDQRKNIFQRFEAPPKTSLFVKLVQTDHDAEDARVLEFIAELAHRHII